MNPYDVIIVGAGHNGLVAAAYLAKAGLRVLVLERRSIPGGIAATEEISPGFRCSTVAHLASALDPGVIADLQLERHGLEMLRLEPPVTALLPEGGALSLPSDASAAAREIARFSRADASKLELFNAQTNRLVAVLGLLLDTAMPDRISGATFGRREILKLAWKLQQLGSARLQEFLRIVPMSLSDFLDEWFETEILKAALAGGGLFGGYIGPRGQGTTYIYLHHLIGETNGGFRRSGLVRGGLGALAEALTRAARAYGAEIRTGVDVVRITGKNGAVNGVVLRNGELFSARVIVSNADVRRTFLELVEPTYLEPGFLRQVQGIRARGNAAKINLALDALPRFRGVNGAAPAGLIHIGPSLEYLERAADDAKYGRFSRHPFLEITIPSLADASLAPPGKHVMSVWAHSAPYSLRDGAWAEERDRFGDVVLELLENHAPGLKGSVLSRQVLTPLDLEEKFALTGGHVYHGELALDQILFMRPVPGWARYRTPLTNLYLCGSGTHPGGPITGKPGRNAAREILRDLRTKRRA